MNSASIADHIEQLRDLAEDFEDLHADLRGTSYTPGTDAYRRINPLLFRAQDLTATAVVRLTAVNSIPDAAVAGAGLSGLSEVVASAGQAGADLACAVQANASQHPAEATLVISTLIAGALQHLHRAATGCLSAAHGIGQAAAATQPSRALVAASPTHQAHTATGPALAPTKTADARRR